MLKYSYQLCWISGFENINMTQCVLHAIVKGNKVV